MVKKITIHTFLAYVLLLNPLHAQRISCSEFENLSFSEVLNQTLATSPFINKAKNTVDISALNIINVKSSFYPRIDFVSSTQKIEANGTIPGLEALLLQGQDSVFHATSNLKFDVNLYNGGQDIALLSLAEERSVESHLKLKIKQQEIATKILTDYHNYIQFSQDLSILDLELKLKSIKLQFIKKQFDLHQKSAFNLSEAEYEYQFNELTKKSAERKLFLAKNKLYLNFCIGNLNTIKNNSSKEITVDYLYDLNKLGFSFNSIITPVDINKSRVKQLKFKLKQSSSGYLPKVDLFWSTTYAATNDSGYGSAYRDQERDKTYMGINLSWNIFNGFKTQSENEISKKNIVSTQFDENINSIDYQNKNFERELLIKDQQSEYEMSHQKLDILKAQQNIIHIKLNRGLATKLDLSSIDTKIKVQKVKIEKLLENIKFHQSIKMLSGIKNDF